MERIVIVTGAAMGNGFGIASVFAEHGDHVVMLDRDKAVYDSAKQLKERGLSAEGMLCDITSPEMVEQVTRQIIHEHERIDVLVNNAGVARISTFTETTDEQRDLHIRVNLCGTWNMTQAVIPGMRRRGFGRVIMISSVTGPYVCDKGYSAYAMTKAGLIGLTKALAREYAESGITVNAICPGFILTPNVRRSAATTNPKDPESVLKGIAEGVPMKRLGLPEEIGHLAYFLAGEEAGYITGTENVIDGGNLLPETNVMGNQV